MGGSPGDVSEEPVLWEKRKKGWRMSCDVGEATKGLENELWRRWSDEKVGEWALQPFFRFSCVTSTSFNSPGKPPVDMLRRLYKELIHSLGKQNMSISLRSSMTGDRLLGDRAFSPATTSPFPALRCFCPFRRNCVHYGILLVAEWGVTSQITSKTKGEGGIAPSLFSVANYQTNIIVCCKIIILV